MLLRQRELKSLLAAIARCEWIWGSLDGFLPSPDWISLSIRVTTMMTAVLKLRLIITFDPASSVYCTPLLFSCTSAVSWYEAIYNAATWQKNFSIVDTTARPSQTSFHSRIGWRRSFSFILAEITLRLNVEAFEGWTLHTRSAAFIQVGLALPQALHRRPS